MSSEKPMDSIKSSKDVLKDYITYFEKTVKENGWDDETAAVMFQNFLEIGNSYLHPVRLQQFTKFSDIKSHLINISSNEKINLSVMLSCKQGQEGVLDFRDKIVNLVDINFPSFEERQKEQLYRDFFINGLFINVKTIMYKMTIDTFDTLNKAVTAALLSNFLNSGIDGNASYKLISLPDHEKRNHELTDYIEHLLRKMNYIDLIKLKEIFLPNSIQQDRRSDFYSLLNLRKRHNEHMIDLKEKVSNLIDSVYPKFSLKSRQRLSKECFISGLPFGLKSNIQETQSFEEMVSAAMNLEKLTKQLPKRIPHSFVPPNKNKSHPELNFPNPEKGNIQPLKERPNLDSKCCMEKLKICRMKQKESLEEYKDRIMLLIDSSYECFLPEEKQQLYSDFFYNGLPGYIKTNISFNTATTIDDAYQSAEVASNLHYPKNICK